MDDPFWIVLRTFTPNLISFFILIGLSFLTFKKIGEVQWAKYFWLTLIAVMIWIIGDFIVQVTAEPIIFNSGGKILYTGIVSVPFFWLLFSISYSGHDQWIKPWKIIFVSAIPICTLIIIYIDKFSPFIRKVTSIQLNGSLIVYTVEYGPWFWVHTGSSYLMLLLSGVLLIYSTLTTSELFTGQKVVLTIAFLFPWMANILYVTGISGYQDYTVVAFTALALILMANFFKFKFLDIGPVARSVVFAHMVDPVIVIDRLDRIIDLNPSALQLIQQAKSLILGQPFSKTFPEFVPLLEKSLPYKEFREEIGIPSQQPNDHFSVQINVINDNTSGSFGKVIVLRNINEQEWAKKALLNLNSELESRVAQRTTELQTELDRNRIIQEALRISDERYSLAIEGAKDGIWDWDLSTGEVFYSSRWKGIIGYADHEVAPTIEFWFERVHAEDRDSLQIALSRHLDNIIDSFELSHRIRCKDGNYLWVLCRGKAKRGEDGIAYRISGSLTDISQQKKFEEQILFDAFHDQLTGLSNRAYVMEQIAHLIEKAKRYRYESFAVIYLDVDRFKLINDSLGHSAGDILLTNIAKRLKECMRSIDTVARLGGDEFIILVDSLPNVAEVSNIAERIIETLNDHFVLNGNEVSISASLGIAIYSDQYENHFDILRDADIAMYQAKKNSFRRYEVFQPEMRYKVESRLKMETDIRRALQSNEFELYYQPILSVKDLNWVSSEALIRWHNPIKGMISPTEFIPIAEETGLIIPLGRWVIREVCKQITTWKSIVSPEKNIVVSINLSAKQFSDPRLCEEISGNLIEYQLEGKNLVIEVTESTIIEEQEKVVTVLSLLRRMGIQVHIDDFGTGYSSLSYLQMLPFDAVKIDRSFINQMSINCDKTSIEIIQTIISLSKELRKTVIAEGVETQGELDLLANMDCEYFQGFLVSKPMGQADATKYLKKEADGSQLKLEQFSALTKFQ